MAKKREKSTMKKVQDVRSGEFVRPESDWEAYNASLTGFISLNVRRNYKVARPLNGSEWLHLEPGREHHTTTEVHVYFPSPTKLVKVFA